MPLCLFHLPDTLPALYQLIDRTSSRLLLVLPLPGSRAERRLPTERAQGGGLLSHHQRPQAEDRTPERGRRPDRRSAVCGVSVIDRFDTDRYEGRLFDLDQRG